MSLETIAQILALAAIPVCAALSTVDHVVTRRRWLREDAEDRARRGF